MLRNHEIYFLLAKMQLNKYFVILLLPVLDQLHWLPVKQQILCWYQLEAMMWQIKFVTMWGVRMLYMSITYVSSILQHSLYVVKFH